MDWNMWRIFMLETGKVLFLFIFKKKIEGLRSIIQVPVLNSTKVLCAEILATIEFFGNSFTN